MNTQQIGSCETCSQFSPLENHLYELGMFCEFLDNSVTYIDDENDGNIRVIKTSVIAQWLKLAGQLKKVDINTWQFADDTGLYCDIVGDMEDSNSEHLSDYSTALTRFIFVSNALEETYRYVENLYNKHASEKGLVKEKRLRNPNMKAAYLIDQLSNIYTPNHFEHKDSNFRLIFSLYQKSFKPQLSGLNSMNENSKSYGLHLIRNLRNHVAHGVFPLIDNPEYFGGNENDKTIIIHLLLRSCRLAALYIQMFIRISNQALNSYEYSQILNAYGEEFEYFISNCNIDYVTKLHLKSDFSLSTPYPFGYAVD